MLRGILLLALCSLVLVIGVSLLVDRAGRAYLMEAVAGVVYLVAGVVFSQSTGLPRRRPIIWGGLLLTAGIFLNVIFFEALHRSPSVPLLLLIDMLFVLPGWFFLVSATWQTKLPITRNRMGSAVFWSIVGCIAGSTVVLVWYLSARFSTLILEPEFVFPSTLFFWQRLFVNTMVLAVGEELLFRRGLFRRLYWRLNVNFWPATAITLCANGVFYAVQMVLLFDAPDKGILFLLGPYFLAIINCALYALKDSIIAPLTAHLLFKSVSLFLGLSSG